jgi:hypothetical protein
LAEFEDELAMDLEDELLDADLPSAPLDMPDGKAKWLEIGVGLWLLPVSSGFGFWLAHRACHSSSKHRTSGASSQTRGRSVCRAGCLGKLSVST